jgi:hypothetical protein
MRLSRRICGMLISFNSSSLKPQVSSLTSPPVVVLRIERSVIRLSAEFRPPAFDYQSSRAPRSRTESLLLPKQACYPLHLCPNHERKKDEGRRKKWDWNRNTSSLLHLPFPFFLFPFSFTLSSSGLGGARILVCGFSGHR